MLFERVAIQNVRLAAISNSDVHCACAAALVVQALASHVQCCLRRACLPPWCDAL